ncbi:hydrolase [Glycomyces sp. NPDC046736]|uniref:hydrolase n=1 Tax=Glycomyces sp. NPDC046736 TaxID=3155615 RepID=UPI0033CD28A4
MTATVYKGVSIPVLDRAVLYDVVVEDGRFARVDVADRPRGGSATELWPGYTEAHAHFALPCNWDDSLDSPRITALQHLYHGVTHVVDKFGFPVIAEEWEAGKAESPWPYPEVVHCGYAVTAMTDGAGRNGHGVEFPAPVYMLAVESDLEIALRANEERGATFLKAMFTDGTEQPGSPVRFSRMSERILRFTARMAAERGLPAVIDCNTLEETRFAYECGFRLFAHSVRDTELTEADWKEFDGARFVSTLAGLRPMIMTREDFDAEYGRPGFAQTQDPFNLEFVQKIEQPYGIEYGVQETRTAALTDMRANALAALDRGRLLVGTDSGNLGAYHGYSFLSELDLLRGDDTSADLAFRLREQATVGGRHYFDELAGRPAAQPIAVGQAATFNLIDPAAPLSALPETTVVQGTVIDRDAVAAQIAELRAGKTKGKVVL